MILHILKKKIYEMAVKQKRYTPSSITEEGFIHCSTLEQLITVADNVYRHEQDLCVMVLDRSKIQEPVVFEDLYELNDLYPHIYGHLNMDACVAVVDLPCERDGHFKLPEALFKYR